jgi:hypothetical protein
VRIISSPAEAGYLEHNCSGINLESADEIERPSIVKLETDSELDLSSSSEKESKQYRLRCCGVNYSGGFVKFLVNPDIID